MALHKPRTTGIDTDAIQVEIDEARTEQQAAQRAKLAAQRRRPTVESLVSYFEERRAINGFGEDFEITHLRRKPS
jgi:hypothetical protein